MSKTVWVVALLDGGCYAGKQIKRFKSEVEVELLDALMLFFCLAGEGSLTGEVKRFPVEACRFFNDIQAMGQCVGESIVSHKAKGISLNK